MYLRNEVDRYTTDTAAPLSCNNTASYRWDFDNAAHKEIAVLRNFDSYGNETRTTEYGNIDVPGDERTTWHSYFPDTTDYLVSCLAREFSYTGINGTSAAQVQLSDRRIFYDGAITLSNPPGTGLAAGGARCDPTMERVYYDATHYEQSDRAFDSTYGNPMPVIDPAGPTGSAASSTTQHIFGDATHLHETETDLPKSGFKILTSWQSAANPAQSAYDGPS